MLKSSSSCKNTTLKKKGFPKEGNVKSSACVFILFYSTGAQKTNHNRIHVDQVDSTDTDSCSLALKPTTALEFLHHNNAEFVYFYNFELL